MRHGWISEVFTSIQGEGIYAGRRMEFVRLAGCTFGCRYCDTKYAQNRPGRFLFDGVRFSNPVEAPFLAELISEPEVCVTGGEPMEQPDFLKDLTRLLKRHSTTVHLETNGTITRSLSRILPYIDVVAVDFKIPSATRRPGRWVEHERFLGKCRKKNCFVKIVVDRHSKLSELDRVLSIVGRVDRHIPLVIQPRWGSDITKLLPFQERALEKLDDVRIIPQIHKYLRLK